MEPIFTNLNYTYKKDPNIWVLNIDDIPFNTSKIMEQQIVYIGPKSIGGNHKHPRTEWFVAVGDLVLIWLDEQGEKHEEHMNTNGQLRLSMVPPFLPHAVENRSSDKPGLLYEYADAKLTDDVEVKIV